VNRGARRRGGPGRNRQRGDSGHDCPGSGWKSAHAAQTILISGPAPLLNHRLESVELDQVIAAISRFSARRLAPGAAALLVLVAAAPAASASPRDVGHIAAQTSVSASGFYIRGGGFGHGIGMSQYGTLGYAEHGWSYDRILAHYYQGTKLGTVSPSQLVTVLLKNGSASFGGATRAAGHRLSPGTTYTAKPAAGGGVEVDGGGKKVGTFAAPLTVSGKGPLTLSGAGSYRGSFVLRPDGSGGIETVNSVDLEDYVRGVVSAEMPSSWPEAALEAQAVAARTYVLTAGAAGSDFDVYSDTRSQMYRGVAAETPSTDAAIAATRGQVVTYAGNPVVTYFFSSSGGWTESIQNVWPGATAEPWLRGVRDPYDGAGGNPYHRWGSNLSVAAAAARLRGLVEGSLVGIQVVRHGFSPRIITAEVVGTRGRVTVSGARLQSIFGLMSTLVSFTTISVRGTTATGAGASSASGSASGGAAPGSSSGRTVSGSIFPTRSRVQVIIQKLGRHGFTTVAHVRTGRAGSYRAAVSGAGQYRVSYGGVNGPIVNVR